MKLSKLIITLLIFCSSNLFADNKEPVDYSSVVSVLESLKKQPSANVSRNSGWEIVSLIENGNHVIWFFAPVDHAAYPALIKKTIRVKGKAIETEVNTLCEAPKPTCDSLIKQFKNMSEVYK